MLLPELEAYVEDRLGEFDQIADERRKTLEAMADFVASKVGDGQRGPSGLHLHPQLAAKPHGSALGPGRGPPLFGSGIRDFLRRHRSDGLSTRRAVAALRRAGFVIEPFTDGKNPVYEVRYRAGDGADPGVLQDP